MTFAYYFIKHNWNFMKKMIIVALVFAATAVSAQKIDASKVPSAVKNTFSKNFPGITDIKWEMEKGDYEANFKQNGQKMSAVLDPMGALLETETGIATSDLPAAATAYIAKNYKGGKIKDAARLKMANGDINYEAEVKGMDVIFDANGKFLKTQKD